MLLPTVGAYGKLICGGKLLHVFNIRGGTGTTNIAFGPSEKELYVSVVKDANDPKALGSIVRIPNDIDIDQLDCVTTAYRCSDISALGYI